VEVEVWMHRRQDLLVACVRMECDTEKSMQTHPTPPDVTPEYLTYRTHRTESLRYESQDPTPPYLMQDCFLLLNVV